MAQLHVRLVICLGAEDRKGSHSAVLSVLTQTQAWFDRDYEASCMEQLGSGNVFYDKPG